MNHPNLAAGRHERADLSPPPPSALLGALISSDAMQAANLAQRSDAFLESGAAFRALAETIPHIVWATGADGGNTYVNQQWYDYTGLTQDESRGAGWNLTFHPDDRQRAWDAWQHALQHQGSYEIESRMRRADGVYRWWLIRGNPSFNAQGEVQQWLGTCTDIDDLKRAGVLLRESDEKLRLATEAAGLGVWSWDPVADVVVWENAIVAGIVGLALNEPPVNSAHFTGEFLHPDDLPVYQAAIARTVQNGEAFSFLGRIRRRDGAQRWIEFTGRLGPVLSGQPLRVLGTIQDLTERKEVEAALRRRHADAQLVSNIASRLVMSDPRGHRVDPEHWLEVTFARLAKHLGVEYYFNYVVAEQPDTLRLVSSAGLDAATSEADKHIAFGTHLCGMVAQTRQPLVLDALSTSVLPNAAGLKSIGVNIYAGFPLLSAGRLIGTIGFASARAEPFKADELELIQLIANLMAAALERERLSERVRTSEARFRQVFQYAGTGIATADLQGRFLSANPAFCRLLGYSLDALRGVELSSLTHPDDRAQCAVVLRRILEENGAGSEIECRYLRQNGSVVWAHKVVTVLRDEAGQATSVVMLVTDVTQRKLADIALCESEERFHAVADRIPQLAWMADSRGNVGWLNEGWLDYTGTTLAENLHAGWKAVLHPDYVEAVDGKLALALKRGEDWEDTFPLRAKDGHYRWFLSRMSAVRNEAGRVLHYFGTNTDITERVELEETVRQHSFILAEEARRKDEFLATLAHELRNPLAPVRNAVQVLKIKDQTARKVQWASEVIERQMQQMTRLIDDLMDISRINRGRIELKRETMDLAAAVQCAVETIGPLADECGHTMTLALPQQACFVDADPMRITQVFFNLLNNAVKYTECGRIDVQLRSEGGDALVFVRDNGIGLCADRLHDIFGMFSQVESALHRSRGGLGIGLSLVKRLVELHGGHVEARSEGPGRGSEFVVRLPMVAGPDAGDVAPAIDAVQAGSGLRILVVDDNRDTADSLSTLLELMGNTVRSAYDGKAALTAAADFHPEVVVSDIGMPGMNGYELCRRLRQEPWGQAITIIATSGWGQPEDRRKTVEAGFDQHLVKPVDPHDLLALLNRLALQQ